MDMRTAIIRIFECGSVSSACILRRQSALWSGPRGRSSVCRHRGCRSVFGIRLCYWRRAYTFGYRRQLAPAGRNRGEARRRICTAATAAHLTFPPQFTAVAIKASAPAPAAWRYSPQSAARLTRLLHY